MNNEFNQIRDAYQRNMFAQGNNVVDVQALYKALPDVGITSEYEENLYHLAARFTDTEGIRFLQSAGLKPGTDKYGNTALHTLTTTKFDLSSPDLEAKAQKIQQTAALLLELGINPKKKNDSGKLAYFEAGLLYMYPFMEAMANAGVKMNATADEGKNLLHIICEKLAHRKTITGAVEAATKTVRLLIEKGGIDLEDKDVYNTTPLTYAQRSGVKEIAALLSGDESDVATGGMTIHEAVLHGDTVAVETLIKAGTDLNEVSDQYGRTALMLACEYPSAPMVQLLANGGADVNFRSGNGETAVLYLLTKAVSNFGRGMSRDIKDIREILRTLINQGLDLNAAVNNESDTALNIVCQAGYLADLNTSLAEELVEAGCDINLPNASGKTPLMSFAERGNENKYSIAELLLDNQADTTYADKNGNTALMYAAANTDKMSGKKIVSLILDQDTSTADRVNNAGQTAMDIAVKNDNEAVVKQLLEAMA
ncbi:ankyrin repeat domain-containing protein [Mucilaginibacter sp. Bleaf8]|uniref:ankyrin repeat domain-containing protein n=1 Tax=Mucilaginibacter sp. Bleaf8 TaxID=2834430 RepID=UPI001BCB6E06|nr:ankyrin repeat domain-containing protein [Mucilaginibacter sp. Bleaf8]MBS7567048.1 ankyrin repeat domain-containing protein [Mucilaginibacter sp. Bleaf8]